MSIVSKLNMNVNRHSINIVMLNVIFEAGTNCECEKEKIVLFLISASLWKRISRSEKFLCVIPCYSSEYHIWRITLLFFI